MDKHPDYNSRPCASPLPVGCGAQLGDVLGHVGVLHQEQSLGQAEHLHPVSLDLLDQPLDLGDARAAGRCHAGVVQAQAGDNLAEQRVVQLSAPLKLGLEEGSTIMYIETDNLPRICHLAPYSLSIIPLESDS